MARFDLTDFEWFGKPRWVFRRLSGLSDATIVGSSICAWRSASDMLGGIGAGQILLADRA